MANTDNKTNARFAEVPAQTNFPAQEEQLLAFWQKEDVFWRSVSERSEEKTFTFYDGPPFASGLPHYGHLLASIIKDVVPRYWTMRGYRVERRFGWTVTGFPLRTKSSSSSA